MTLHFLMLLVLGAALGGFMNGLAGFGTALFALGFWLQIMPPVQAVSIVALMAFTAGIQGIWLVRRSILNQPARLARFLLPALAGVPFGVALLTIVQPNVLKLVIAGFLILYGGFFTFRAALPKLERSTPIIDGAVGFLSGIMGGAASLSGALLTMWCALRPWPKAETRAVFQPFNLTVTGITSLVFAIKGSYTLESLSYIAVALPVVMVFAQIGIAVFKRLTDDQFRRLLIGMMFVSGIVLMVRELAF